MQPHPLACGLLPLLPLEPPPFPDDALPPPPAPDPEPLDVDALPDPELPEPLLPLAEPLLLLLPEPSVSHVPATQAPPGHTEPSGLKLFVHCPVAASHTPSFSHGLLAVQSTGGPATHAPAWHVSPVVHALPSSHAAPSAFATTVHAPVFASHAPASWH